MQSSQQSVAGARPVETPPTPGPIAAEGETGQEETHEHIHLPPPTIWPVTLAGGVALGFLGIMTSGPVSFLGLLIATYGLVKWIQELRHELH